VLLDTLLMLTLLKLLLPNDVHTRTFGARPASVETWLEAEGPAGTTGFRQLLLLLGALCKVTGSAKLHAVAAAAAAAGSDVAAKSHPLPASSARHSVP
jgi:hypothetical protein